MTTPIHEPIRPKLSRTERRAAHLESANAKLANGVALTVYEAAALLDCSAATVRAKCNALRNPLPHERVGNEIRIWPKSLGL